MGAGGGSETGVIEGQQLGATVGRGHILEGMEACPRDTGLTTQDKDRPTASSCLSLSLSSSRTPWLFLCPGCLHSQMPNLMVAPLLGDEEVQREEAQEDSNGCESRGSKELGTEGRVS